MHKLKEKWNTIPLAVKVSSAYAICSILQRCLSFITLPLFTRLLTTEQYGQVTVYQSWQGILSIFLTLNLMYGSFSTAMVKYEDDRDGYISSIEGIFILLLLVFFAIYIPFNAIWNKIFKLPTFIICLMGLEIIASASILLWNGKKRFEFKYKSVVAITLCTSIISTILQYILVVTHDEKGIARILGAAITIIVIGSFFIVYNTIKGKKLFNKKYWKYALEFNIPLLVYYLSQVVFNQSDRLMIDHYIGASAAAIYGVSYNLSMVLMFVLNAVNNAYLPWLYTKYKAKQEGDNKKIGNYIAILMGILILFVIWLAPEIIRILASEAYYDARWIVPPVAMSLYTYLYVTYSTNVEFYFEDKGALVRASVGSAILNVVLNAIFIPRVGYIAAGYTTLASYILFALYNYFEMRKIVHKKNFSDGYDWKTLVALYIVFAILATLAVVLYEFPYVRVSIVIIVLIAMIVFRKRIIQIAKKFKEELNDR